MKIATISSIERAGVEFACTLVVIFFIFLTWVGAVQAQGADASAPQETTWTIPSDEQIRKLLAERMEQNGVGIVVGIIEPTGRRVIAHGKRSATDNRPLDGDTIFQIGSVTKVFTGLLLADMIQRGEVRLDDPATKYLPPNTHMPERGRPITLLDLATHQSGLPSMPTNFDLHAEPNPYEAYSVKQLFEFLGSHELPYAPGERAEYSNLGVALLGRLLANRTGIDYEKLLQQRVLKPLDMNDTSITLTPAQLQKLAPGHDRFLQPVATWEMVTMPASGPLRSTANDMLKFLAAYLGYLDSTNAGDELKSAMEYQRSTRQPPNGSRALGLSVRRSKGEEQFGHDGGKEGYRAGFGFNPQRRTGVVVLANARTDDLPINIALHIASGRPLGPPHRVPLKPGSAKLSRKTLDGFSGMYRLAPNEMLAVARKDDHLLVDTLGDGVSAFYSTSSRDFYSKYGQEISFERGSDDSVAVLILREGGKERKAERVRQ